MLRLLPKTLDVPNEGNDEKTIKRPFIPSILSYRPDMAPWECIMLSSQCVGLHSALCRAVLSIDLGMENTTEKTERWSHEESHISFSNRWNEHERFMTTFMTFCRCYSRLSQKLLVLEIGDLQCKKRRTYLYLFGRITKMENSFN